MKSKLEQAYTLESPEQAEELYQIWAQTYDHDLVDGLCYVGPKRIALDFPNTCSDRDALILDAGCGTGLVGETLAELGYRRIDGLDLVQAMLDEAQTKGIYQALHQGDLLKGTGLPSGHYDAAISMGTFTHHHVGPDGLDEIVRVLRPGGVALISINRKVYDSDGFARKFGGLTAAGKIEITRQYDTDLMLNEPVQGRIVEFRANAHGPKAAGTHQSR